VSQLPSSTGVPPPSRPPTARQFHLIALVGRGAFGEVYLAEQHSGAGFRKKVVLKLLHEEVARMAGAKRRMRDEARILGLLAHRHIVAVHDLLRVDTAVPGAEPCERWAILMDYVPGADLERVLEALVAANEPFPVSAAVEVGASLFEVLDFAANAMDGPEPLAVVHRDIKPSNIRLTPDGDMKVLDFGTARFSHDDREAATRASGWIGTERYMSPERLLRQGDTAAGDVYAAAATVVELLLGRPLGRTPLVAEPHDAFVSEALELVRPRIEDPEVADGLLDALRRGLRGDPQVRAQARELQLALETLLPRLKGPTLRDFARSFIPRVDSLLGVSSQPVSGTLVEYLDSPTTDTQLSSPSLTRPSTVSRAPEPPYAPQPAPRQDRRLLVLLGVVACGVGALLVALGAQLGGSAERSASPAELAPAPPAPVPAAPVPVEPVPVEPPVPVEVEPAPVLQPLPEPEPEPEPAVERPTLKKRPRTAEPPPAPRVDKASFSLRDASHLLVRCGGVSAAGTASVRIVNFPAGSCRVEASWLGGQYVALVQVERVTSYTCRVDGGVLRCSG
jgi:serine/threonine protein kinase